MGGSLSKPNRIKDVYTKLVFYDNGELKYDDGSADQTITSIGGVGFTLNADEGSVTISLNNSSYTLAGGTGIETSVSGSTISFDVEDTVLLDTETIDCGGF
jgi:hypothetical protein